ncbi:MAG: PIN domain-containing protein [Planctomycetes bacterium]|nr:PIN domain-containing protein [Planctomycetota bacterium]
MKRRPEFVLDASALLALLQDEPEAAAVERLLGRTAAINSVNWSEVLTKLSDFGADPDETAFRIRGGGALTETLQVLPFQEREARKAARLRQGTRAHGLSLGDRACLATAGLLRATAVTTDGAWEGLRLGVGVRVLRRS